LTRSTSESSGPAPFFDEPPLLELRADGSYTCVDQPPHNTNASAAELARAADLRLHEAAVTVSQANYNVMAAQPSLNLAQQALAQTVLAMRVSSGTWRAVEIFRDDEPVRVDPHWGISFSAPLIGGAVATAPPRKLGPLLLVGRRPPYALIRTFRATMRDKITGQAWDDQITVTWSKTK